MLSSLPHWASCEVFPEKQPASLVSMPENGPLPLASQRLSGGGGTRGWNGTQRQMGCLEPRNGPRATPMPPPNLDLVHTPTPPGPELTAPA